MTQDLATRQLNDKEIAFCELKLLAIGTGNAAVQAGFSKGHGFNLMCRTEVKAYLKKRSAEIMADIHAEQAAVFTEIKRLATSDIRDLYDPTNNELKPMTEWPEDIAHCVASVKHRTLTVGKETVTTLEVKLWNKNSALENLARSVGLVSSSELNLNLPINIGSIYFPQPKPEGAPVDPLILEKDKGYQVIPESKEDKGFEEDKGPEIEK